MDTIGVIVDTIVGLIQGLIMVAVLVGGVFMLIRQFNYSSGSHQVPTAAMLGTIEPRVARRLSEIASDEQLLLAIPADRRRRAGWLIATTKRIWWISAPHRHGSEETEFDYASMVTLDGVRFSSLPLLTIGEISFSTSRDDATAMSQLIRQQRDAQVPAGSTAAASAIAPGGVGVADEIGKLAAMRDSGILTDEEFNKKKRELLG